MTSVNNSDGIFDGIYNISGYIRHKNYILTIKTNKKYYNNVIPQIKPENNNYALYSTNTFYIINIEDILGNVYSTVDEIVYYSHIYNEVTFTINTFYNDKIYYYYLDKKLAIHDNFHQNKQWLMYESGYSGLVKQYYNTGELLSSCYYNNGPEGDMIFYNKNGDLVKKINFINNVMIR
jgi:hypothetical protein